MRKKVWLFLSREWKDHGLSLFLILLCGQIFIFGPIARVEGHIITIIDGLVFSGLLLVGVLTLSPYSTIRIASTVLVVLAIIFRWVSALHGSIDMYLWNAVFSLIATLTFLVLVMLRVYHESPVTVHKIRGAVAAFLLMAMAFAFLYNIIELLHPGAFALFVHKDHIHPERLDSFLYFSISTITTVGFGDITPVHPIARSLVMLESIIGILYPPILIGYLVTLHTDGLRGKFGKPD